MGRLRLRLGFVNALSGSNWGVESTAAPREDGFAARVAVAAPYLVDPDFEFDTARMKGIRDRIAASSLEAWLRQLTPDRSAGTWEIVSPSRDYVVTIQRTPGATISPGSLMYARLTLVMPVGFGGVWPTLLLDVVVPNAYEDGSSAAQYPGSVDLVGKPLVLEMPVFLGLLDRLARTAIDELAEDLVKPVVRRPVRERLFRRPLRLVGPNFDAREKPGAVIDRLVMPTFERVSGQQGDPRFFFETPDRVDAHDAAARIDLLRRAIRLFLRRQEFLGFEEFVSGLEPNAERLPELSSAPAPHSAGSIAASRDVPDTPSAAAR